jgi:predicted Rossmann fold nucleotide-binding protein DprA/Smf involved in DNA uptake
MAQGVDGIATAAALAAGGSAIAVLGCGIDIVYPKHHGKLMAECCEHGAVITEYAPGTPPNGYNFPIRNRLISALSRAVLVVQAGEHSGALITARYAIMQGRPLYAVPGDITEPRSEGSNRLLQAGAHPALSAEDVLQPLLPRYHTTLCEQRMRESEQYAVLDEQIARRFGLRLATVQRTVKEEKKEKKKTAKREEKKEPEQSSTTPDLSALTPRQRELYALLPTTPFSVDALTGQGVPVAEAISTLTILEIYGLLVTRPGGTYQIANSKE